MRMNLTPADGKVLYGRGACDAKGVIATQICAVSELMRELGDKLESVTGTSSDAILYLLNCSDHECATDVAKIYRGLRGATGFGYLGFVCGSPKPHSCTEERSGLIEKAVKNEEIQWEKPLRQEHQRLKQLSPSSANEERCKQLAKWAESDSIVFHVTRANFYADKALHWTNWPLPDELQVTWRFKFLCGSPPESWFQKIIRECLHRASCDYTYHWVDGLLLQFESVKICVERDNDRIDLSVRCDPDETGETPTSAANLLWHYIAPYLHIVFLSFDVYPRLPYKIFLVPIGNVFYSTPISVENEVDLTVILGAIENQKHSGFKIPAQESNKETDNDRTLFIERCLPGFRPHTIVDLRAHLRTLAAHSRATRKASHPVGSIPESAKNANANLLTVTTDSDNPSKRRRSLDGRRVSFGHVLIEDQQKAALEQLNPKAALEKVADLSLQHK